MNKHINNKLMHDYVEGTLPASDIKFVESHLEECQECLEVLESYVELVTDPEFEEIESTRISHETASYVVKNMEPLFNQTFFQQFIGIISSVFNLFAKPQPAYVTRNNSKCITRKSNAQDNLSNNDNYFVFNAWIPTDKEIIRLFDDIHVKIIFRSVPDYNIFKRNASHSLSVAVKLLTPLSDDTQSDVRVTLRAGDFYEISELIQQEETCHFDKISFAPHCMTFEYQGQTKGKLLFSVLEKAIYIHSESKQEVSDHEHKQQSDST